MTALDEVVAELGKSGKYASLCPATHERIAAWALVRHKRPKDAVKAAKRKLHQVFGAYVDAGALAFAEHQVADLGEAPTADELAAAGREILAHHASSAERLENLAGFYETLWRHTGAPGHVVDLACGFSPFALPFMGLDPGCRYDAVDIDIRLAAAGERFRALTGQPGEVRADDLLVHPPYGHADVALLLKTLPCLERQEDGAAQRLLGQIDATAIVVSYPVRSLGGRDKGMAATYREGFIKLSAGLGRRVAELDVAGELVFLVTQL